MTREEELICNQVIEMLSEYDKSKFGIEQRSEDYLTLVFCDNDFFRVKFTNSTSWISIRLAKQDKDVNDERFKAQKNKNQLHWKANINSTEDIKLFKNELINACVSLGGNDYKARDINHSRIELKI